MSNLEHHGECNVHFRMLIFMQNFEVNLLSDQSISIKYAVKTMQDTSRNSAFSVMM